MIVLLAVIWSFAAVLWMAKPRFATQESRKR
jgi:hypothetical protein